MTHEVEAAEPTSILTTPLDMAAPPPQATILSSKSHHENQSGDSLLQQIADLTARNASLQAEVVRLQRETHFRQFMDNAPTAAWINDEQNRLIYLNAAYTRITGLNETAIGKKLTDIFPESYARTFFANDQLVRSTECSLETLESGPLNDGTEGHLVVVKFPIRADDGTTMVGAVSMDVTDLVRTENALRESEERFRTLLDYATDIIMVIDSRGTVSYASPSVQHVLGYSIADIVDNNAFDYIYPRDLLSTYLVLEEIQTLPNRACGLNFRMRHADGEWRHFEATMRNQIESHAIRGIILNARDITEHRKAQENALRQIKRLNALRVIDMAITASMDLNITLSVVLDQVLGLDGIDGVAILIANQHTLTLEYTARRGICELMPVPHSIRFGEGIIGQVARNRRPLTDADLDEPSANWEDLHPTANGPRPGYYAAPLIARGKVNGVIEVYHSFARNAEPEWLRFLEVLAGQTAIGIENASLFDELQRSNVELSLAYDATIEGWSAALDLRDRETEGHTQRVTEMTLRLAREMGLGDSELVHIRRGALLHDIGKMGVPDHILHKPEALTPEERTLMQMHATHAYHLLSPIAFLRPALAIPYCHHEKWDGTGYPRGLKGEQIPLTARMFAVVDVWDALSSDRVYRAGWPREKVIDYLRSESGHHFDPKIVDVFLKILTDD